MASQVVDLIAINKPLQIIETFCPSDSTKLKLFRDSMGLRSVHTVMWLVAIQTVRFKHGLLVALGAGARVVSPTIATLHCEAEPYKTWPVSFG